MTKPHQDKPPTCENELKNGLGTGRVVHDFNSSIVKTQAWRSPKLKARLVYILGYGRAMLRQ